jgi:uncharacterized protein (TIGR02453 family)
MPKTPKPAPSNTHFRKEGLAFLRALVRANKTDPSEAREWFNANKAVYEAELKEPMLGIIRRVTDAMLEFAPEHVRPAEKSYFRIYRDTRFSSDKRPYKDHVAAWWTHTGLDKTSGAGFYFHLSPKEVVLAAGAYMPEKEQLAAIRHWLVDHHAEFHAILQKPTIRKSFTVFEGNALTRPPKGLASEIYSPGADGKPHPALDLVRCRQWGLSATLPADTALDPGFSDQVIRHFKLAAPLVAALNTPIVASLEDQKTKRPSAFFGMPQGPKSGKTR